MSIDTRNKRASVIGLALAFRLIAPTPGTVGSVVTREQTAYVYAFPAAAPAVVSQGVGNGAWIKLQGVPSHRIDFQKEGRRAKRLRLRQEKQEAELAIAEAERLLAALPVVVAPEPVAPPVIAVEKAFDLPDAPVVHQPVYESVSLSPKPITRSASDAILREQARQADAEAQRIAEREAKHAERAQMVEAIRADRERVAREAEWKKGELARLIQSQHDAQQAESERIVREAQAKHEAWIAADEQDTLDLISLLDGVVAWD